jgi:rhamnosyl/mannosyltransferase
METVVLNIVESIIKQTDEFNFTVYSNNHETSFNNSIKIIHNFKTIIEKTPFHFKSQPLNFRFSILNKLIIDNDIIHHHYPYPNMELALLKHKNELQKKKLIITWHANIENSRWNFLKNIYEPKILQLLELAKYVVVTSPQLYDQSKILKKFQDKIVVIPLTTNYYNESSNNYRKFPENRIFNLLYVGKLRKYKGLNFLIEAIKDLNINLFIIGNGEEEKSLKNLSKKFSLHNKINFLNNISNSELKNYYNNSDLFILPSINEAEAFGLVQLEAMIHGLPVINTNLNSGVPFVSINEYSGLTVTPSNVQDLKSAILKISNNKDLYEKFSINAINRAKEFSIDKLASSYIKLYK